MDFQRTHHAPSVGPASDAPRFGDVLRRHRKATGLTQQALARRAGVSLRAINALESGLRHTPHAHTITLLAAALDLSPEDRAAFEAAGRQRRLRREPTLLLLPRSTTTLPPSESGALAAIQESETLATRLHNLPLLPTPLLGRDREFSEVTALLRRRESRLVTLTGPGGVGKTRLALEAAWALLDDIATGDASDTFRDGVWFVRLAPLSDPTLVLPTIAQALGLSERGGMSSEDQLRTFLHDRSLLVLLDNFEHVADAASQVAALLTSSAGLKLLVTSRAVLHLRGEYNYPVSLLAVPPTAPGRDLSAEQLDEYAATALFVQRARAAQPTFPATDATAPLIAAICARLNGLPLAIELAAARTRVLSPAALLARLTSQLTLLTGGARDVEERQQTMRATLAWSEQFLTADEHTLFRRLAVFAGGCTLEAAEAVCAAPEQIEPLHLDVLDGLSTLVDQSLIQRREEDSEPRFEMLHVIREYALEQLEASGEAEALRRAHAHEVLAFAEEAEPGLRGPDDITWMQRVERELGNVRAALEWAHAAGEAEVGLRLATALWRFWSEAGYLSEGQQWVETLLALVVSEAVETGTAASESSTSSPQTSTIPTWLRARALTISGSFAAALRQIGPALAALQTGLRLARAADDWLAQVLGLLFVGAFADLQSEPRRAEACYEEALALGRAREDALATFTALGSLAGLACGQQRWAEATAWFTEAMAVARAAGRPQYVAVFLLQLGEVALWQGEAQRAAVLLGEALAVAREINWATGWRRWDAIDALDLLAVACAQRSQQERGARLLGAAAHLRETLRLPYVSAEQPRREALVAPVRAMLGAEPWEAAFAVGQRLTLEETFAEALVDASTLAGGDGHGPADEGAPAADQGAALRAERLTRRELEVLRLLAEGWTDARIADQLVLSLRTVNHHVASLYSKLGVSSRAAATRFAMEHDLV